MLGMSNRFAAFFVAASLALHADAGIFRVMMMHDKLSPSFGWRKGFEFFANFLNSSGGFNISGDPNSPYMLQVVMCETDLFTATNMAVNVKTCIEAAAAGMDAENNTVGPVHAIVAGTSTANVLVQRAAQLYGIPNVHCSGGNPAIWTSLTPFAFGIHLPFPWYSRGAIQQAALKGLRSVVVIRDWDWSFARTSGAAAMEWVSEAGLTAIGPTLAWCRRWANFTKTCREVNGNCRCGLQSEWDNLSWKFRVEEKPSFYEVSESLLIEPGFDVKGPHISPGLVIFVRAIIEDVRAQGADPDMVVNWMAAGRSAQSAMFRERFSYKMYCCTASDKNTAFSGYLTYDDNSSLIFGREHVMFNIGAGQWHAQMKFSDPIFGSSTAAVAKYKAFYNITVDPGWDIAACMTAGVALTFGLQKYGSSMATLSLSAQRDMVRLSLGNLNDETLFGPLRFNRFNQNNGRMTVSWQVLEDGYTLPVLPAEAAATSFRFPSPTWDARLGCPAGTYGTMSSECLPCKGGTYKPDRGQALTVSECVQCPAGFGTLPGVTGAVTCSTCPGGRAQNGQTDRGECNSCAKGTARPENETSGLSCGLCPFGRYAATLGLSECVACPSRSSQPERGQISCVCDLGSFRNPDDTASIGSVLACKSCEEVLPGSTTLYPGTKQSTSCTCPSGSYWSRSTANATEASCKQCGEGLLCKGGFVGSEAKGLHQPPLQAAGYAAGSPPFPGAGPSFIVYCDHCPAGLELGTCPEFSKGRACAQCIEGAYLKDGTCKPCAAEASATPFIVLSFLSCPVILACLYFYAVYQESPHCDNLMTLSIAASLLVLTFQILAGISKIDLPWVQPMSTIKNVLEVLSFNVDILRPACVFGLILPVQSYVVSLLIYPCFAITLLIVFAFCKFGLKRLVTLNHVVKAEGFILSLCFTSACLLALMPFRCRGNPDGSSSLLSNPSIQCWVSAEHQAMLALSSVALVIFVLPYMALVIWATWKYPLAVVSPSGIDFVIRFSFLFGRFDPKLYYFSVIVNVRNFLIALIPAILAFSPELQLNSIALVVIIYAIVQNQKWPWRTELPNRVESALVCSYLLILMSGCMLLPSTKEDAVLAVQVIPGLALAGSILGILIVGCFSLYRHLHPSRPYGIFLSHHKVAAAVLCRWIKLMIGKRIRNSVFYDSDDVNRLDKIIDVTAFGTYNVVVLLTSQTLARLWCAGEIASAYRAGTNIVLVSCDEAWFSESLLLQLDELWSQDEKALLRGLGISLQDISESYTELAKRPAIHLSRKGANINSHSKVLQDILIECKGLTANSSLASDTVRPWDGSERTPSMLDFRSRVCMLGDMDSPESSCCCWVIQSLLQQKMQKAVSILSAAVELADVEGLAEKFLNTPFVLVVLTSGVLERPLFASMLAECPLTVHDLIVPIQADQNFVYPNAQFWKDLSNGLLFSPTISEIAVDVHRVTAVYKRMLSMLAAKFTAHGSEKIQTAEIEALSSRLSALSPVNVPRNVAWKQVLPSSDMS